MTIAANSGIEVAKLDELVTGRSWLHYFVNILIELLLIFTTAGQSRGISADDSQVMGGGDGEMKLPNTFINSYWKIWQLMEEGYPKCKSDSMNHILALSFALPVKCVAALWYTHCSFISKYHCLRAAISIVYHASSVAIRAVLHWGHAVLSLSRRVCISHVPKTSFLFFCFCLMMCWPLRCVNCQFW